MKVNEQALSTQIGICVKTLQNWRTQGRGPPYYKVGGRVLYDLDEIGVWLATQRVAPHLPSAPAPARTPQRSVA